MSSENTTSEDILNIADYETAANIPTSHRHTTTSSGRAELKDDIDIETAHNVAEKYANYLMFCDCVEDISELLEKPVRPYAGNHVLVSPYVTGTLAELGIADRPITATVAHLWSIMQPGPWEGGEYHQHGVDPETLMRLPWLLERPVLVANSTTDKTKLLLVLAATDDRQIPLIAPIKLDALGHIDVDYFISNLVCSLFGHDNFYNYFGTALPAENVVFIDSQMELELEDITGRPAFLNYNMLKRDCLLVSPQTLGDVQYNPYPDHDTEWTINKAKTFRRL